MLHKDLISPPPSQQHSLSLYKDPFSLSYSQKPAKTRARWPKITIFLKVPENLRPPAPLPYSRAIAGRAARERCWECSGPPSPPPLRTSALSIRGHAPTYSPDLVHQKAMDFWPKQAFCGSRNLMLERLNFISEKGNRVKNEYNNVVLNNWCCNLMLFPFVLLQSS